VRSFPEIVEVWITVIGCDSLRGFVQFRSLLGQPGEGRAVALALRKIMRPDPGPPEACGLFTPKIGPICPKLPLT